MERRELGATRPGLLLLCLAAAQAAFGADSLPPPVSRDVNFSSEIQPLFRERCTMCHGGQQESSGLRLDRKADALRGGYSGPVIVPGVSAESKLIRLVAGMDGDLRMPPVGDRLTPQQISLLRAWIDQGAVWPEAGRRQCLRQVGNAVAVDALGSSAAGPSSSSRDTESRVAAQRDRLLCAGPTRRSRGQTLS